MRTVKTGRLIILSVLLVVTAILVHVPFGSSSQKITNEPLRQVFANVGVWRQAENYSMDQSIVEALKLDDYLFQSYGRDKKQVNLYIGYYHTAKKVGAAHDPLVCFQGQGWQINSRQTGEYLLNRNPDLKISYSSMIAQRQNERQMIVYWFQVNDKATGSTSAQKVAMVLDRLSGGGEDNAFVRISASIEDETPEAVRKRLFEFIEDFYPAFFMYLKRT